jgi:hypothetical protein
MCDSRISSMEEKGAGSEVKTHEPLKLDTIVSEFAEFHDAVFCPEAIGVAIVV